MQVNLYLREFDEEKGHLIGTCDPVEDDLARLREMVSELGVSGDEPPEVFYQFIADKRGAGIEVSYRAA